MRDITHRIIAIILLTASLFGCTRTAISQISSEEAQMRMLEAEDKPIKENNEPMIHDLSGFDVEALRLLVEKLYRRIHELESQLERQQQEHKKTPKRLAEMKAQESDQPRGNEKESFAEQHIREPRLFTSALSIVKQLPKDHYPPMGKRWRPKVHGELARQWFEENVIGDRFLTEVYYLSGSGSTLAFEGNDFTFQTRTVRVSGYAQFAEDIPLLKIATFRKRQSMIIEGTIDKFRYFPISGNRGRVLLNLKDCVFR